MWMLSEKELVFGLSMNYWEFLAVSFMHYSETEFGAP